MKMTEKEAISIGNTLAREDISNLKTIQGLLNREINYRMSEMKTVAVPCYDYKTDQFGTCLTAVPAEAPNKKEKKMNSAYAATSVVNIPAETLAERRISHLLSRLSAAEFSKKCELMRSHGLSDDKAPHTPAELVKRIEDGLYVIPEDKKDYPYYNPTEYIQWRNPKIKKDQVGYDEAVKKVDDMMRDVKSTIIIRDEEKGLAAVESFEKHKFH